MGQGQQSREENEKRQPHDQGLTITRGPDIGPETGVHYSTPRATHGIGPLGEKMDGRAQCRRQPTRDNRQANPAPAQFRCNGEEQRAHQSSKSDKDRKTCSVSNGIEAGRALTTGCQSRQHISHDVVSRLSTLLGSYLKGESPLSHMAIG